MSPSHAAQGAAPPAYSTAVGDEQSIDEHLHLPVLRDQTGARVPHPTTFTKRSRHISVSLNDQTPGCALPTCDDAAPISGVVLLDGGHGVHAVELQIEGAVRLHEFGGLKRTTQILRHTIHLWGGADGSTAGDAPPREMPFEFQMPRTPGLPPSFEVSIGGGHFGNREANGFNAWVRYSLSVRARTRAAALPDWTLSVPLLFTARRRAPGGDALPSVHELLKAPSHDPLEFTLRHSTARLAPVQADVSIPRPATYCMRRPIPVCIRLSGPKLEVYGLKASVMRRSVQQIRTDGANEKAWMEAVDLLGDAPLEKMEIAEDYVAWAGQVTVHPNIMAGTFTVDGLAVRDFLVLDIVPPKKKPELLLVDCRISIPIVLTTD